MARTASVLGGFRLALGGLIAVCVPLHVLAADPRSGATERVLHFDIRPQPLEPALVAFSLASGVSVLVNSTMASGKETAGVKGSFAPRDALRLLLRGTGLSPRYSQASSVTLEPVGGTHAATIEVDTMRVESSRVIGGTPSWPQYGDEVRDAVIRSLRADPATANGRYAITLRVWVAPSGRVERAAVVRSSGTAAFDRAVVAVAAAVTLAKTPPDGLPQPVTLEIEAHPPS